MDGIAVRLIRIKFNLTQTEFSKRLHVSREYISRLEAKARPVSHSMRKRIVVEFGLDESDIIELAGLVARLKEYNGTNRN